LSSARITASSGSIIPMAGKESRENQAGIRHWLLSEKVTDQLFTKSYTGFGDFFPF